MTKPPRLIPSMPYKASSIAENHFKREGVNVYLNTEYNEKLREELGYDYVLFCTGNKYDATKTFMKGELSDCLD